MAVIPDPNKKSYPKIIYLVFDCHTYAKCDPSSALVDLFSNKQKVYQFLLKYGQPYYRYGSKELGKHIGHYTTFIRYMDREMLQEGEKKKYNTLKIAVATIGEEFQAFEIKPMQVS